MSIIAENKLEEQIMQDPEWVEGSHWGMTREGHPEGLVIYHIEDVLQNVNNLGISADKKEKLRIIAIIHDTFKYKVDILKSKVGRNNHAVLARIFAEKYIQDKSLLRIIEQHDEVFNAWKKGCATGAWDKTEERLNNLLQLLGDEADLYYLFFRCDNETGDKSQECVWWFEKFLQEKGLNFNDLNKK
ncbi:MAG: HD domain-containing protein [Candidatus Magasanikbacteria bacterium]|nr:HD domain-containing protein [Candidatus Magasanikbacteria bacterium]